MRGLRGRGGRAFLVAGQRKGEKPFTTSGGPHQISLRSEERGKKQEFLPKISRIKKKGKKVNIIKSYDSGIHDPDHKSFPPEGEEKKRRGKPFPGGGKKGPLCSSLKSARIL